MVPAPPLAVFGSLSSMRGGSSGAAEAHPAGCQAYITGQAVGGQDAPFADSRQCPPSPNASMKSLGHLGRGNRLIRWLE
jgi:hypothetical protein